MTRAVPNLLYRPGIGFPGLQILCLFLVKYQLITNIPSADLSDDAVFGGIVKALVIIK